MLTGMATPAFTADRIPSNLRALRKRVGLTQTELADRVGMNQQTYSKYESGALRLRVDMLAGFAQALECQPMEILTDLEDRRLRLTGAVVNGGAVVPIEQIDWSGPLEVDCPRELQVDETEAFVVLGDVLLPMEPGTILFARKPAPLAGEVILGRLCIVVLRDGQRLVKQVRRGYTRGRFNLLSANAAPIEDAEVEAAGLVQIMEAPKRARGAA